MRFFKICITLFLAIGYSSAGAVALSDTSIQGIWTCGPTTMHGPDVEVVASNRTTYKPDYTFESLETTVVTARNKPPLTVKDRSMGTWSLDDDVFTENVRQTTFLSSSDETLSPERGQEILDAQLKKKATFRSRILFFDGKTSRSFPIDSMYKAAEVESSCQRI